MLRPPPSSTRTDTLCPYPTLCRSQAGDAAAGQGHLDPARRDVAADVAEPAAGDHPVRALVAVGAGALAAVLAIRGRGQLGLQGLRIHRHARRQHQRSAEPTSELQPLIRLSYAVYFLKYNKHAS